MPGVHFNLLMCKISAGEFQDVQPGESRFYMRVLAKRRYASRLRVYVNIRVNDNINEMYNNVPQVSGDGSIRQGTEEPQMKVMVHVEDSRGVIPTNTIKVSYGVRTDEAADMLRRADEEGRPALATFIRQT